MLKRLFSTTSRQYLPSRIQHQGKNVRLSPFVIKNEIEGKHTSVLSMIVHPASYKYDEFQGGTYVVDKQGYLMFKFYHLEKESNKS